MGLWDHLEELRKALFACALALLVSTALVVCFLPGMARLLMRPLHQAMANQPHLLQGLVTTSPMGVFSVLLQVCLMGGVALALPFMLFFMARFIAPGLTQTEKHALLPAAAAALCLFFAGASFSYFWLLPLSLQVAIELNRVFGFELIWSAPHYYGLVVWMTLGIGLCFEFPLVLILLIKLGVIQANTLARFRRHAFIIIMVLSAFITPGGDPLSLIILTLPLYGLFELSIWIGKRLRPTVKESESEVVDT